jgi:AcrR family transcriptional regulator
MARPSQQIDQALLRSGRQLFPALGCAGLSLRAVTQHAGVNPGMFHYHFRSKENFLRALLQQMYEEMFAALSDEARADGPAIERLRAALVALARFARANRRVLARAWMDAMSGEKVAREFFRANAPRHLRLLFGLLEQAHAEGALRELPPLQRFALLMGGVLLPLIFVAGLVESGVVPAVPRSAFEAQVASDAAIAERIELILGALQSSKAAAAATPVRHKRAPAYRRRRSASERHR